MKPLKKSLDVSKDSLKWCLEDLKKQGIVKSHERKFESGRVCMIKTQPKPKSKFDMARFRLENPEMFDKYSYTPDGVLRVTIK